MSLPLIAHFERDLRKLADEISHFKSQENLWKVHPGITNSAGNLVLHLTGNLNYFIGTILGNTGYVRDRDREFAAKDIAGRVLIEEVDALIPMVIKTLSGLSEADLQKEFPAPIGGKPASTESTLIHLYGHFNYHLGQINYLRRILEAGLSS
ncbi:MAG: DinB family protein [Bacteroidota bacterium]|nr:DinB family protein [Bacteroidota bacterium]